MSSLNLVQIRAAIYSILTSLTGAGQPLDAIYDNDPSIFTGYPAAVLKLTQTKNQYLDDANNLDVLEYTIWVVQEIDVGGMNNAIGIVDAAVEAVITAFQENANTSLNGTVDFVEPVTGKSGQTQTPNGMAYYQEVILKCNVVESIN